MKGATIHLKPPPISGTAEANGKAHGIWQPTTVTCKSITFAFGPFKSFLWNDNKMFL